MIKHNEASERRQKLPALVLQKKKLYEMAEILGVSYPQIQQDLEKLGMYEDWKRMNQEEKQKIRTEKKSLADARKNLVCTIGQIFIKKAYESGLAIGRAAEVTVNKKKRSESHISFEQSVKIFRLYQKGEKHYKPYSLEKIGKMSNTSAMGARRTLAAIGLESHYGSRKRGTKEDYVKKRSIVKSLLELGLSQKEVRHFAKSNCFYVCSVAKECSSTELLEVPKNSEWNGKSWSNLSLLLEAKNAGNFDLEEMAQYSGLSQSDVIHALSHRKEYEQALTKIVKIATQGESNKPYI